MRKVFTVDSANRMLPLVRRIVEDIVRDYAAWQDAVAEFELAALHSRPEAPDEHAESLQADVQRLAGEIEGYLHELNDLGIELKGLNDGLVDFPGELDERPIYLCWRLGEPSVQFWHEVDTGFAGRQPLVAALTDERAIVHHLNP